MLVEHIIEPSSLVELAKSRRNCKDFEREFSKPSPRVISNFPKLKKFKKLAFDAQSFDVPDLEKARLEALLDFLSERERVNRKTQYDGNLCVEDNFKIVDQDVFFGIHFMKDSRLDTELTADSINVRHFEQGIDSLPTQVLVPKVAKAMCTSLGELLRLSQHITLIDPYISASPVVWNTVLALLEHTVTDSPVPNKTFSMYFSSERNKRSHSCQHLKVTLEQNIPDIIDKYLNIEFCDIKENGDEGIHNRYLITELGGVILPYGFGETNEDEMDDVTLLDEALYARRYKQFVDGDAFEIVERAVLNV